MKDLPTERRWTEKVVQENTNYYNSFCSTCIQICHLKCSIPFTPNPGDAFLYCAINNLLTGRCCVCSCSVIAHYHVNYIVQKEMQDSKEYEALKADLANLEQGTYD